MRKFTFLLTMLTFFVLGQVRAEETNVTFDLSGWSQIQKYGLTTSYSDKTVTFTKTGDGDYTSGDWSLQNLNYTVSNYDYLVIETGTVSNTVELQLYQTNVSGLYKCDILSTESNQTIYIPLRDLATNGTENNGNAITTINRISLFAMGDARTIEVKSLYLLKESEEAAGDFFTLKPATWRQLHGYSGTASYSTDTKKLTINTTEQSGTTNWSSASFGARNLTYKVADYASLVVDVGAVTGGTITLSIFDGDTEYTKDITTEMSNSTVIVNMSDLASFTKDGSEKSITTIDRIHFMFMSNETTTRTMVINSIYFIDNLKRNTAQNSYGTICLPFDATVTNATLYNVIGYGKTNNKPSCAYAVVAEKLEAGKAYVYKATGNSGVTFSKADNAKGVTKPNTEGPLKGLLTTTKVSGGDNIYGLSGNKFVKIKSGQTADLGSAFKAYLDLTNATEYTTSQAKAMNFISFDLGDNEVTAISNITVDDAQAADTYYDLSGRSIAQPTKPGIYVKNGKKYIIK